MRRFRNAILAVIIALATASTQADSDNGELPSNESPSAAQKRSIMDELTNLPTGRVESRWKRLDVVCGAEAFLLRSLPAGPGIDDTTCQAIQSALADNNSEPILWIRMEFDVGLLLKILPEFDPNNPELNHNQLIGTVGYKKPELAPFVLKGHLRTEKSGIRLDQSFIFQLPPKTTHLTLNLNKPKPVTLAQFSLTRLLLSVDEIFPYVRPRRHGNALNRITTHARKLGLKPLEPNHLRFFVQPAGIVSEVLDIDLMTGEQIHYPGTHSKETPRKTIMASNELSALKKVLESETFTDISQENDKFGMDGISYLVEVHMNGSYHWKLHWSPDDENLKKVLYQIKGTSFQNRLISYRGGMGAPRLAINRVRLLNPMTNGRYCTIEIDLTTGKVTGSNGAIATPSDLAEIKSMLASDAFTRPAASPLPTSADRTTFLIEVNMNGIYQSRLTPIYNLDDYGYRVARKIQSLSIR